MNRNRFTLLAGALWLTLSAAPAQAVAPASSAPALAGPYLNQPGRLSSQELKGKVVYVDFWASWCGPCRASFPVLDKLYGQHKDKGFVVLGINQDDRPEDAQAFLARIPVAFPLIVDSEHRLAADFEVKGMPSAILVDRKGIVRHVHRGFRSGDEKEIAALVEQLLAEQP
jgi:thiol-disulfide isomerase/thioredoxin